MCLAGLLCALALVSGYRIARTMLIGEIPHWRAMAGLELWLALSLYVRGPQLLIVVGVHAVLLLALLCGNMPRLAAGLRIGTGLAAVALMLAPWSVLVSRHFQTPVLTTTNVPLVLADSFGNPARTCFGPCGAGYDIWPAWHFAHNLAARTGQNELAVQRQMMKSSLSGLTLRTYLQKVRTHFTEFLFDPSGVADQFMRFSYAVPRLLRSPIFSTIAVLTWLIYLPFLLALLIANMLVFRRSANTQLQSLLIKVATACMFLQPFVHKAGPRYWVTFAPLMAWSAALIVLEFLPEEARASAPGIDTRITPLRAMNRVQWAYITLIALIGACVILS